RPGVFLPGPASRTNWSRPSSNAWRRPSRSTTTTGTNRGMTVIKRGDGMRKGPNIRLFSTDLDGTLLGNPEAAWRFTQAWESLNPGSRPLLVYNTGRTVADTRGLAA